MSSAKPAGSPASPATGHPPKSGFSSPIYRGELNHGAVAELQEGFRLLTNGQKVNVLNKKDLFSVIQAAGLHTASEEELGELLRAVHQSVRQNEAEDFAFTDFLLLMTKEVPDNMLAEMKTAFLTYDKNKTGFISKKQFTEMFISMGEHSSAEEMEELLMFADSTACTADGERIEYGKFIDGLVMRLNMM